MSQTEMCFTVDDVDDESIQLTIRPMLDAGATVAFGVSGGKDSSAMVLSINEWLDRIGHTGYRCLIHADLGMIEWTESMGVCQALADKVGLPLHVCSRTKGGMIERWEQRWDDNTARWKNLECVKLITPWSTPSMRFCTSELKVQPIASELKLVCPPGIPIINAVGIRREESPNRAKAIECKQNNKLSTIPRPGYDWNPILDMKLQEVWDIHKKHDFAPHPAYTKYGSTRLSCSFCILASQHDLLASMKHPDNEPSLLRIAQLEMLSGFSFQSSRWLADLAGWPTEQGRYVKLQRSRIEGLIPKHLEYVKGWPTAVPTESDCELLMVVRERLADLYKWDDVRYLRWESIQNRYEELIEQQQQKGR